jgi:protein TonB
VDKLANSGVPDPTPPPPTQINEPPQQQPQVQPPPKAVEPVKPVEPPKPPEQTQPEDTRPAEIPEPKPKPEHKVKVDLTPAVRKPNKEPNKVQDNSEAEAEKEAKERERILQQRSSAYRSAITSLKHNLTTDTEIKMPGNSSESYANYGLAVVSAYHHAWISPDNMATASAVVSFSVTIARDGSVLSSHIVTSSGDSNVDNAVQRLLDRVTFVAPFPEESSDRERTYHIDFNATRVNIQ